MHINNMSILFREEKTISSVEFFPREGKRNVAIAEGRFGRNKKVIAEYIRLQSWVD